MLEAEAHKVTLGLAVAETEVAETEALLERLIPVAELDQERLVALDMLLYVMCRYRGRL